MCLHPVSKWCCSTAMGDPRAHSPKVLMSAFIQRLNEKLESPIRSSWSWAPQWGCHRSIIIEYSPNQKLELFSR